MRLENWPLLLAEFVASRQSTPFQWGVHDCTLFAADAARAITGNDLAAEYRGLYSTEIGAARIIVEAGSLRDLVNQHMDPEINPKMAQRGDWVMVQQNGSDALAVCMGVCMVAAGPDGLISLPMSTAITAWRVN